MKENKKDNYQQKYILSKKDHSILNDSAVIFS